VQLDFAAGALLGGIYDAGVERTGVNVEANGALIEFAGIQDAVDGLQGIDGARMRGIHLKGFRGPDCRFAGGDVLMNHAKILDQQTADGTAIQQFWSRWL